MKIIILDSALQVLGEFNKFILDCKALPREMQWTARSLIANEQGGPFPLLSVATPQPPKCRTLTALVVHTAAVFFSRQKLEVLWPFLNMLTDPAKLAVSEFILDPRPLVVYMYSRYCF